MIGGILEGDQVVDDFLKRTNIVAILLQISINEMSGDFEISAHWHLSGV
jgi:hypothetical protein